MTKLMGLLPTQDHCCREVGLDAAGKPVRCNGRGYVRMDGKPFCRRHFGEMQKVVEVLVRGKGK